MSITFQDSTIFLHHLLSDVPEQASRCSAVLQRIEDGELKVRTADTVIIETVVTLERGYEIPKHAIAEALQPSSSPVSRALNVPMSRPSRRTEARSATSRTSSSRCAP
jgi:predicted nucleic acid-binding protein